MEEYQASALGMSHCPAPQWVLVPARLPATPGSFASPGHVCSELLWRGLSERRRRAIPTPDLWEW